MAQAAFVHSAYKRSMIATAGVRSLEAEAFEKINAELQRADRNRHADYPAFVSALSRNLKLWTILAADVASEKNGLPLETRTSIWKIAAFVRKQTQGLIQPNSRLSIVPLIDMNASMAAGLRGPIERGVE